MDHLLSSRFFKKSNGDIAIASVHPSVRPSVGPYVMISPPCGAGGQKFDFLNLVMWQIKLKGMNNSP